MGSIAKNEDTIKVISGKVSMMSGAYSPTLFGLIGETKANMKIQSLGGIVDKKPSGKVPSGLITKKIADMTEGQIGSKNATKIPRQHFGSVSYSGPFLTKVGPKL